MNTQSIWGSWRRLLTLGLAAALAPSVALAADPPRKPNIVLVLADDIGWGDAHCYNPAGKIPTPNIDRLAETGMRFTHAHTPAALCAPTRYAMLTGNYPCHGRAPGGTWGYNVPDNILPGQKTVAELLKPAGYRCAMFGKSGIGGFWEENSRAKSTGKLAPVSWGFDYSWLIPRGHQSPPNAFFENGVAAAKLKNGNDPDWDPSKIGATLLEKAIAFIDDHQAHHAAQPFYLHFCTDGAHTPYVPAETLAGHPLKGVTKMTDHTDMVHETDLLLGALMAALDQRGLRENTLIVYTSDNGGLPYERELGHDAVAGLRGAKAFIFEGGHRVPFVAAWPGHIEPGTVRNQTIGAHDIVATAIDLAGLEMPAGQARDSVSLKPVLLGQRDDSQPVRQGLLVQSSPGRGPDDDGGFAANQPHHEVTKGAKAERAIAFAVCAGDWKLVFGGPNDKPAALYNLANDLGETTNLLDKPENRSRVEEMEKLYRAERGQRKNAAP